MKITATPQLNNKSSVKCSQHKGGIEKSRLISNLQVLRNWPVWEWCCLNPIIIDFNLWVNFIYFFLFGGSKNVSLLLSRTVLNGTVLFPGGLQSQFNVRFRTNFVPVLKAAWVLLGKISGLQIGCINAFDSRSRNFLSLIQQYLGSLGDWINSLPNMYYLHRGLFGAYEIDHPLDRHWWIGSNQSFRSNVMRLCDLLRNYGNYPHLAMSARAGATRNSTFWLGSLPIQIAKIPKNSCLIPHKGFLNVQLSLRNANTMERSLQIILTLLLHDVDSMTVQIAITMRTLVKPWWLLYWLSFQLGVEFQTLHCPKSVFFKLYLTAYKSVQLTIKMMHSYQRIKEIENNVW